MLTNAGEPVLVCPYNKAHSIIKSRMQFHLSKCRLQHPHSEKTGCPYNSTHIVPKLELEFHQQICDNRIVLDSFLYNVGNSKCPVEEVPLNAPPEALAPCEENWDEDPKVSVLESVKEGAKGKKVLINLIGAPKAERKAHRVQERLRYQRVLDSDEAKIKDVSPTNQDPTSQISKSLNNTSTTGEFGEKSKLSSDPVQTCSKNCKNREILLCEEDEFEIVSYKKVQGRKNKQRSGRVRRPPLNVNRNSPPENNEIMTKLTGVNIDRKESTDETNNTENYPENGSIELKQKRYGYAHNGIKQMGPIRNAWEKPLNMKSIFANNQIRHAKDPVDDVPSLPISGRGRALSLNKHIISF